MPQGCVCADLFDLCVSGGPWNPLFEDGREVVFLEGINAVTLHDGLDTLTGQHLELMLQRDIS